MLDITAVDIVSEAEIDDRQARAAGYESAAALVADLRGTPGDPVYRIAFSPVDEPDPRSVLAQSSALSVDDRAEIARRLARLDGASSFGPWTAATLACIEAHPARRSDELAALLGRERAALKVDIRKLKNLGLTLSLERGYRLSPRGEAWLASAGDAVGRIGDG